MTSVKSAAIDEIDEEEEEALLKSDDENDLTKLMANADEEDDSLMAEELNNEDDDDDEEDSTLLEFNKLLNELQENQYDYNKYVQLCELSHATADLDNIRKAYNSFAAAYPLSAELWLKYLEVELNVSQSVNEIAALESLFRKALNDYYSPEIALKFVELAPRAAQPELIWREILGTYGLHPLKGQAFFQKYRAQLAENAYAALVESYVNELKYPLHNMEERYIQFKVYYEKNKANFAQPIDWTALDKCYFKAKEHLQKIMPYEELLNSLDAKHYQERALAYDSYIKETDKFLDENVLQTVYERMVADCCLNADCWLSYINFIEYRDEFGRPKELQQLPVFQQNALDINRRALRNCSWSEKLYIKRLHLLEKYEKSKQEVQQALESSLSAGFQTAEPTVAIWLEYLTYLRRHTDWQNEAECEILRKNFNLAWTVLGQQWGVLADCNCEILQFWGRLEYGPLQDAKRGKELWSTVMESSDNATKSGLWIEFAQLEMRNDLKNTRKLYQKALNTADLDNPAVIASAWQRFERCNGSLESLTVCTKECEKFLQQYNASLLLAASSSVGNSITAKNLKRKLTSNDSEHSIAEKAARTNHKEVTKTAKGTEPHKKFERKQTQPKEKESAFKEHENQEIDLSKDHLRIFLSNLDYNLSEDDLRVELPELKIVNINLIRSANGRSRGFGYLELANEAEVEKALTMDRKNINGRPLFISSVLRDKEKRQKFKYSDACEPTKLFVKGLPDDVTKEELEQIFDDFGKLKDVRLVYHKSGKFKNIAYVDYMDEKAAAQAQQQLNDTMLRAHKISVLISAPPPKKSNAAAAAAVNANKLLGISKRGNKMFEQKPRMSLIPSVVRQKLGVNAAMPPPASAATTNLNGASTSQKSNADFRKLLLK